MMLAKHYFCQNENSSNYFQQNMLLHQTIGKHLP